MKYKFVEAYMDVAKRFAQLSSAKRLQVGAIIVKDDRIISIGYNGMPAGWPNDCETKEYMPQDTGGWLMPDELKRMFPYEDGDKWYRLKTRPEVIHAEANAIAKLAKGIESGEGAVMFLTHAPCIECAKQIYTSGIKTVYYAQSYRSHDGIEFLKDCGVEIIQV
jgi:dCMP deaminase